MKFFGTDGIRGTVGEWPLVPEFFLKLGQATGKVLKSRNDSTIIIGRDTRQSCVMLQNALCAGLLSSGISVYDVGVIPTSAVSWLVSNIGGDAVEAGVVISASHNPVQENGIKFFDSFGKKLAESTEAEIENLILNDQFQPKTEKNLGRYVDGHSFQELYIQDLIKEHPSDFLSGLTIVVDCANGAASFVAPDIFQRAGANVIAVNASPTGLNINFNAGSEYVRRSPEKFSEIFRQNQADFGLAFDGDADRVVFVDEEGTLIDGDHMLGFLSRYLDQQGLLLERSIVTTSMRNEGLKLFIESRNLTLYETPVGDKYVVDKLMQLWNQSADKDKIGLGGEQAGHIILLDKEHIAGDGIRTALFVLNAYLKSQNASLAEFAAGVGKTPQIIASAYVGNGERYTKQELEAMGADILEKHPGIVRINLRYSGTEPLLRTMIESNNSHSEEELAKIAIEISHKAQKLANQLNGSIDILNCTRGGTLTVKLN
jgi:phosphoglucosamine mutase